MAVGIFYSTSTTKSDNNILEVNLDNHAMCRERFMILATTFFYKYMVKVQILLYKTDGVAFPCLCNFLVSILK